MSTSESDTQNQNEEPNYDSMSDEDFMNQVAGAYPAPAAEEEEEPAKDDLSGMSLEDRIDATAEQVDATDDGADNSEDTGTETADGEADEAGEGAEDTAQEDEQDKDKKASSDENHTTPNQGKETAKEGDDAAGSDTAPDYEKLYNEIMKPFKANGKEFAPTSPDEVVRLMQMGANYTKKMQGLKPNLKMLRMLENNGLLQEDKISFLIDLDKKNPEAIKKLLHEGKIDPLDLDLTDEPAYKPGNHSVSDAEMDLQEAISTVKETPTGLETIRHIDSQWDSESKNAVAAEPVLLGIINEQRSNGLYDLIASEIDRRKILGEFAGVPFIQAYKAVGDQLHAEGKLVPKGGSAQASPAPAPSDNPRKPVDTRPARQSKPAAPGTQVRGVAPAPGKKTAAKPSFNPLTMSDEEIMAVPTNF